MESRSEVQVVRLHGLEELQHLLLVRRKGRAYTNLTTISGDELRAQLV